MIKQVIVMRKDLGMRKGKMIAQGAHASLKVFFDRAKRSRHPNAVATENRGLVTYHTEYMTIPLTLAMAEWADSIFTKICVSVNSEEELLAIVHKANLAKLPNALIQDAGKTEFDGVPTYTCCAIGPADAEKIDEITGELKLL